MSDPTLAAAITLTAALSGQPARPTLPLDATLDGVEVTVIAREEYKRLMANDVRGSFEEPLKALRKLRPTGPAPLPSTVQRDPEVASFLRDRFARADTVAAAHAAWVERFGAERTPSRSRIQTFRMRMRGGV